MSLIEAEAALDDALSGAVKRKGNNTRNLRSKASRVSRGVPEVMVKIKSFGKGALAVKRHLQYISRNGDVELETDRGEILQGREEVNDFFKSWKEEINDGGEYKNRRDTMHMILSMPEHTPPEAVRLAAREFAKRTFAANHEYVFALHTDEPHPHVHITVKMLGFDGKRLHIDRDKPQQYRETFADALRDEGVEAEATPRLARGAVRKEYSSVVKHMTTGSENRPPRESDAKTGKIHEARDELLAELRGDARPNPWEERVRGAHERARQAWARAASALQSATSEEDRSLADRIAQFVDQALPSKDRPPITERSALKAKLVQGALDLAGQAASTDATRTEPEPPQPRKPDHER